MNTPLLFQDQIGQPSVAQLFGSNYEEAYLKHLPEQVQFRQPIVPRLDIGRTKKLAMRFVDDYDLQLQMKYQKKEGKRGNPEYSKRRLNSGTMATFDAMIEMYAGYCNANKEGAQARQFSVSPSGIASRRYKAVKSMNTIGDHLERLEAAGLFKSSYDVKKQKYNITWNLSILVALPDRKYSEELANMIVNKAPKLRDDENFSMWLKHLNPSFFACFSPASPQFLSMYLFRQEPNINSPLAEFVSWGKRGFPPNPLPKQEQGDNVKKRGRERTFWLPRSSPLPSKEITSELGAAKTLAGEYSEKEINDYVNSAYSIAIGILSMWWSDDITLGKISEQELSTTKQWLRYWIFGKGQKLSPHDFIHGFLRPVLYNLRRSVNKKNYQWKPQLYIFFDPNFLCDDGSPAGFQKSIAMYEKNQERIRKSKLRKGTKKKIREQCARDELFSKAFKFVFRNPSEKNYIKAEEKIRARKDKDLMKVFIKAIENTKLLPKKFMQGRTFLSE